MQPHCVSRWNVYILQKMIHGPSNVKYDGLVLVMLTDFSFLEVRTEYLQIILTCCMFRSVIRQIFLLIRHDTSLKFSIFRMNEISSVSERKREILWKFLPPTRIDSKTLRQTKQRGMQNRKKGTRQTRSTLN